MYRVIVNIEWVCAVKGLSTISGMKSFICRDLVSIEAVTVSEREKKRGEPSWSIDSGHDLGVEPLQDLQSDNTELNIQLNTLTWSIDWEVLSTVKVINLNH